MYSGIPQRTADIAAARCGILIPGKSEALSEFAVCNINLQKHDRRPASGKALNAYYEGRHLACLGFGSGKNRTQLYLLGEDGLRGHRHAGALTVQLYAGGREIFPDLGYICDHPGNKWVKATPSHQTVVIDGQNSVPAAPGTLLGFVGRGPARFVDMSIPLAGDILVRRAVTLLRKDDGLPILVDLFDVEGGRIHDYNVRVNAPPGTLNLSGPAQTPRKQGLYQEHSFYPLLDFQTGGKVEGGWTATWGKGREKVRATVLTPCTERITYGSPGWRNQHEITAEPGKYADTLVLRNRKKQGRFVVVYECLSGPPKIKQANLEETGNLATVHLALTRNRAFTITLPGAVRETSDTHWHVKRT